MLISKRLIEQMRSCPEEDIEDLRARKEDYRSKNPKQLESPERLEKRFRLHLAASENPRDARGEFERIINGNDLTSINYLERGTMVSKSVGRVHIRDSFGSTIGYGTGFLVAPNVLMTNNHVLERSGVARMSAIEFDFEYDVNGVDRASSFFGLLPDQLFFTDAELDFSVVAVATESEGQRRPLSDFSWLKLIGDSGKALLGEYLTIPQHPGGERKQICVRENQLIRVDEKVVWYATDTLGGSSGSPVFNNSWQVVALHHLGVPDKDADGNWLTVDGKVWDDSMDESKVKWIANEGVRISRIMAMLQEKQGNQALLQPLFDETRPNPPVIKPGRAPEAALATTSDEGDARPRSGRGKPLLSRIAVPAAANAPGVTMTVPIEITIRVGEADVEAQRREGPLRAQPAGRLVHPEEKISIDPDYSNRKGFDEGFLGAGTLATPLPKLSAAQLKDVANLLQLDGDNRYVLKYHHYSVVINAKRKIAFFTAVNIDGELWRNLVRETDFWIRDPRVAAEAQTDDSLYGDNPLDKGHLVRRLDPAWGESEKIARVANDDTFHYTNCSPQHQDLNRKTWAGLEDYILKNASAHQFRANVFTGPVFAKSDPVYRGVAIPKQFWKVALMVKADGKLSATAYLLSQAPLLKDLEEEEFRFSEYKTYQVPIRKIEKLTGLNFGKFSQVDPLGTVEGDMAREIQLYANIKF
jgi:endonuclease G